jgi:hypothetical protein
MDPMKAHKSRVNVRPPSISKIGLRKIKLRQLALLVLWLPR